MAFGVVTRALVGRLQDGLGEAAWPVRAIGAGDLAAAGEPCIVLLLWRIALEPALRNAPPPPGAPAGAPDPRVTLHYLLLAEGGEAIAAQDVLARAMGVLEAVPILSRGGDAASVQLVADPLDAAVLAALWHALGVPLRPAAAYAVRGVRLPLPRPG
jgi:hypothetical protein